MIPKKPISPDQEKETKPAAPVKEITPKISPSVSVLLPPVIPNVSITSYTNVNNKVLILLSKNLGPFIVSANYPASFSKKQNAEFAKIINLKGFAYKDGLIYSLSEGKEKFFVVYRTDKKPTSYQNIIKEQNIIKRLDITKLETSLLDSVSPNTKNYYCFKVENQDGTSSDVTLVYEIEIVDQSGTIYMKQNVFKPEKKKVFKKILEFEDRTRIAAADTQINVPDQLIKKQIVKQEKFDSFVKVLMVEPVDTFNILKKALASSLKFLFKTEIVVSFPKSPEKRKILFLNGNLKIIDYASTAGLENGIVLYQRLKQLFDFNTNKDLYDILYQEIYLKNKAFFDIIGGYDNGFLIQIDLGTHYINIGFGEGSMTIFKYDSKNAVNIYLESDKETIKKIPKEVIEQINAIYSPPVFISVPNFKTSDLILANSVFDSNRQFKARIQSLNSKKKFDININYNIVISEGIKTLSETGITKNFEVLQTEEI